MSRALGGRVPAPVPRSLALASIAVAVLVGATLLVRLANPYGAPGPSPSGLIPMLWAIGALVVLVLTASWAPTLAWTAAIVGSTAAALGAAGYVLDVRALNGQAVEPILDPLAIVALLVPPAIAAAYATSDGQRSRAVVLAAWGAVAVIAAVLLVRLFGRSIGTDLGGLPEWAWLTVVAALASIGWLRDLRPALSRTRERLAAGEGREGAGEVLSALRIFVDELVPGREAGRAEAVESERGRLAADLHAELLPSLRRALAEAEAGGTVERLAADLRSAVDEVESLLVARRSIVLEEMGLLAAVEWLAERVEERSTVRVDIEVTAPDGAEAGRPPREVERAAFRVAQLALDNVVRHAAGNRARVGVRVSQRAVRLSVQDDGDGPPIDEAAATRAGRRGIADMRAEARACGAALEVTRGDGTPGTRVAFRWPS